MHTAKHLRGQPKELTNPTKAATVCVGRGHKSDMPFSSSMVSPMNKHFPVFPKRWDMSVEILQNIICADQLYRLPQSPWRI
jgi:hypothetical protein